MEGQEQRKLTNFSTSQHRLLCRLAEGTDTHQAIAQAEGYSRTWVSLFSKRPEVLAELARLRAEAEQELMERLPHLTRLALQTLEQALNMPYLHPARVQAALKIFDLVSKMHKVEENGVLIEQGPNTPE